MAGAAAGGVCGGMVIPGIGPAGGAALTGFVALYYLGLTATIYAAALMNVGVSAAVWRSLRTDHV